MATMAVFIALGGTSYAAISITGRSVQNGSLTGADIKNNSIKSGDVRNRSLLAKDFKAGQLPAGVAGAAGPTGPTGAKGDRGPAGPKGDEGEKGDTGGPGRSALSPLQAGETVRGIIGNNAIATAAAQAFSGYASLPVPAPAPLDNDTVHIKTYDDPDELCTGTAAAPSAPPGHACIYLTGTTGVNTADMAGYVRSGQPSSYGIAFYWYSQAAGEQWVHGSWAYTAPA